MSYKLWDIGFSVSFLVFTGFYLTHLNSYVEHMSAPQGHDACIIVIKILFIFRMYTVLLYACHMSGKINF